MLPVWTRANLSVLSSSNIIGSIKGKEEMTEESLEKEAVMRSKF